MSIIHEFKIQKEAFEEIRASCRRLHISMDRGVKVGHFLRFQEIQGDSVSMRQTFVLVTHLGEIYQDIKGKKIQEIWFRLAAIEGA